MRSILLLSIAALPMAAFAQARNVAALAPGSTMTAAASGAAAGAIGLPKITVHESVLAVVAEDFAQPMISDDASLSSTFGGPQSAVAPKIVQWTALPVSQQDLAALPKEAKVSVKMIVNHSGKPELLQIAQSAGKNVDQIALDTVKNYRFSPAEVDKKPVDVPVTVTVTIDKQ